MAEVENKPKRGRPGRPKKAEAATTVNKKEDTNITEAPTQKEGEDVVSKVDKDNSVEEAMKEAAESVPQKAPEEMVSPVEGPTPVVNPQSTFYDPDYDPVKQHRELQEAIEKKNRISAAEENTKTRQMIMRRRLGR